THARIERRLGGRRKMAALVSVLLVLVPIAIPTVLLTDTLIDGVRELDAAYDAGKISVPPPPKGIDHWPFVGDRLGKAWRLAHDDLQAAAQHYAPQLEKARDFLRETARGAVWALLKLTFSFIVMAIFLATATASADAIRRLVVKLEGNRGHALVS